MEERLSDSSASVDEDDWDYLLSESSEDENNTLLPPRALPNILSDSGSDASDPENFIKNVSTWEGETSNGPGISPTDLEEESISAKLTVEKLVCKSHRGSIPPKSGLLRGKHKRRVPARKRAETELVGKKTNGTLRKKATSPNMASDYSGLLHHKVHKDRIVSTFPKCFHEGAVIDKKQNFDPRTLEICRSQQPVSIGLKICKMIIIGDVGVGKTSLVSRYCKESFDKDYKATIGVDFEVERFEILGCPFTLQMWDTAGQERFQCIAAAYYRGAHVVSIVFDLSDIQSLKNARIWLQSAMKENQGQNDIKVFLVGTKRDIISDGAYRDIEAEAVKIAKSLGAEYWATSALSGDNVKKFFSRIAVLAFENTVLKEAEKRTNVSKIGDGNLVRLPAQTESKTEEKSSNCCKSG